VQKPTDSRTRTTTRRGRFPNLGISVKSRYSSGQSEKLSQARFLVVVCIEANEVFLHIYCIQFFRETMDIQLLLDMLLLLVGPVVALFYVLFWNK
jgi:hypothetical protein